ADEKRAIEKKGIELASRVDALAGRKVDPSLLADVDIYRKAAEYILRFPEEFATKAFIPNTMAVLDTGLTRARELEAGAPSWPKRKGHVVRVRVAGGRQRSAVWLDDPGVLRRHHTRAPRYLAARNQQNAQRSRIHHPTREQ